MRIAVDLDDVVMDFTNYILACLKREYGIVIDPETITSWDDNPLKDLRLEGGRTWWDWLKGRDWLWSKVPAIEGAIGGIDTLRRRGHYVEALTSKPEWAEWCHSPWARVLMADLSWTEARKLEPGDRIVAFDEDGPNRHFRTGTIQATTQRIMRRVAVETSEGQTIVTPGHKFLTRTLKRVQSGTEERHPRTIWVEAQNLQPGDAILSVPQWTEDRSWEAGYAAGQFDGEGWLSLPATKDVHSALAWGQAANRPDVAHMEGVLASLGFETRREARVGGFTGTPMAHVHIAGGWQEQMRFLGSVRPRRLLRHPTLPKLWEQRGVRRCGSAVVQSIAPMDDDMMVALETDAKTYIADGLLSHNTVWAWAGKWRPSFNRLTVVTNGQRKVDFSDADVLVDDALHNLTPWLEGTGRSAIVFDRPWNRQLGLIWVGQPAIRAYCWADVLNIVEEWERA